MADLINNSTKIKEYNIGRSGNSTKIIALPAVWLNDNKVGVGQSLDMHRVTIEGKDCLLIVKRGKK